LEFKTTFKIPSSKDKISYADNLLFLGSCFAENISAYFENYKFQVTKNPFGIIYNPHAINRIIDIALNHDYQPEAYSFENNGIWSNFDTHSSLSSIKKEELILNLSQAKSKTHETLKKSNYIFISLGTAWIYKHIELDRYVANCHKIPQKHFQKQLLDLNTTHSILTKLINSISTVNSNAKIIFTLSPVRHLKDGFIENQQSKSILHLAIQEAVNSFKNVSYFPSYELLLDDLRDYRFYDSDFLHPNKLALDYIWSKLQMAFFDDNTLKTLAQVDKINKRLSHRHFYPESDEAMRFDTQTQNLIIALNQRLPQINF
jgi:hypothetical protein